jgi:hypothetical protein
MLKKYITILNAANEKAPITRFAWGLVGFAAAAAIIGNLVGYSRLSIITLALVLLGTVLVFLLSRMVTSRSYSIIILGTMLMWSLVIFFIIFLSFTVSAFAIGMPCNWADFLEIKSACNGVIPGPPIVPIRPLKSVFTTGSSVSVFAGGPGEPNPGCKNRQADACVTPIHNGRLVLGTEQFIVTHRVGDEARTTATEKKGASDQLICFDVSVSTDACENKFLLDGHAGAKEEFQEP